MTTTSSATSDGSAAAAAAQGRELLAGALVGGPTASASSASVRSSAAGWPGHNGRQLSALEHDDADLLLAAEGRDSEGSDLSPVVTHEVHWEGYVRKKGDWLPRWEERYLVLDGTSLTYYNSKDDARSARNLRGRMMISKVRPENYGKAHGFLMETKGHKHFHLCCSTELEKDMWIEMMTAAIDEVDKREQQQGRVHRSASVDTEASASSSVMLPPQPSPTQVDLRSFYYAFRQLLISHSASPQFFPKLARDVVLTSNYAPTVPFWGEYHGLDGVLHFFSILYETVEFTAFFVTDIAQAKEGSTAVVAGRETMKNRDNGRKFTQQWQHTIEFAPDGRVKSLTIHADPVAASAVFGCNATASLSLPIAAVVGNTSQDNPAGKLHVVVFRGDQISSTGVSTNDDEEDVDNAASTESPMAPRHRLFLGLRLLTDGKTNVYAPTSSSQCLARTRTCEPDEVPDPKWNSTHELSFKGSSRGKPCFMLIEAWQVQEDDPSVEEVIGVAKVNLAPFLALASTSRTVRESVIHTDIARGAVPQWYTLLSATETKFSCGRVQLSISFEAFKDRLSTGESTTLASSALVDVTSSSKDIEVSPIIDSNAPTPQVRPSNGGVVLHSMSQRMAMAKGYSFRDTKRDNHQFRVGNTNFDVPKRYQMIKAVGQGAYGCVIAASDTETGQALAIKNIPNAFNDLIDAKRILREIRLMRHLNHPNLVNLCDLLRPPSLQEFNDVYIVTDLMETDLHRVIHSNQSITDEHIQYFLYQMLVAINYVHSAQVLHRDLKPSNILVNSDCDLKLCDFGLARGVNGMDSGLTEYVVTRWYRAPELLLSSKYDKQMDVWAIGCILAEMLGRRPLFPGHDYLHQLKIIMDVIGSPSDDSLDFITNPKAKRFILRQPKKPRVPLSSVYPRATPACLDLLEKMLVFDPRKRVTIEDALAHPYLINVRDLPLERTCPTPFDFNFENCELTKSKLQELIFEDVCAFHPDARMPEGMPASISSTSIRTQSFKLTAPANAVVNGPNGSSSVPTAPVASQPSAVQSNVVAGQQEVLASASSADVAIEIRDSIAEDSTTTTGGIGLLSSMSNVTLAEANGQSRPKEIDLSSSPTKKTLLQPVSGAAPTVPATTPSAVV